MESPRLGHRLEYSPLLVVTIHLVCAFLICTIIQCIPYHYCMHTYPCYAKAEEAFDEIYCMPTHLDSTHATHVLIDTGKFSL